MKKRPISTSAVRFEEKSSTSSLFGQEPSYFYPYARPQSEVYNLPKKFDSKSSSPNTPENGQLNLHGSVRDLQELRALYIPFISSEDDLTPSSTTTMSPATGIPANSSPMRLAQGPSASASSTSVSARYSMPPGKFASPARPSARGGRLSKSNLRPASESIPNTPRLSEVQSGSAVDLAPDLSSRVLDKFVRVVNSIDMQSFSGKERDLVMDLNPMSLRHRRTQSSLEAKPKAEKRTSATPTGQQINFSSTVYNYANSQLPNNLPYLRVTLPIWPILCLAAQFSQRAYSMPSDSERETFVETDVTGGTNAMVIKSVALDHIDLVVLSIRGTNYTSFKDWASNMALEPEVPTDFLDSSDNLCHAGFLGVAKQMIKPAALRLRQILLENPSRSAGSLVLTGHSTGGAIASLLYAHMLSQTVKSDLIKLRQSFNRIHCVTFGAPPVSIQPLNKPSIKEFQNWLFFSIINEGDPVTLAEKAYVRSLIDLYTAPVPVARPASFLSRKLGFLISRDRKKFDKRKSASAVWCRPAATLALPGRLIVLRGTEGKDGKQATEAYLTRDDELAGIVFGDVMMHSMSVYQRRVEILATEAARAKGNE